MSLSISSSSNSANRLRVGGGGVLVMLDDVVGTQRRAGTCVHWDGRMYIVSRLCVVLRNTLLSLSI